MRLLCGFNPISAGSSFRKRVPALLSAASVLCLAGVPAAQAATFVPAFTFTNNTVTFDTGEPFLLGYRFSTDLDKTIKAIGVYKTIPSSPNNSLGIWEIKNPSTFPVYELLFQTVITTPGECTGDFCWHPASDFPSPNALPPIKRDAIYAIAAVWGSETQAVPVPANIVPGDITIVSPGFRLGNTAWISGSLSDPNFGQDLAGIAPDESTTVLKKAFYPVNLAFETYDSVQTPSPLPLIGAAAAFGWSRKIRRRINLSS